MKKCYVFVIADLVDSSRRVWDASALPKIGEEIATRCSSNCDLFDTSVSQGDTIQLLYSGNLGLFPAILLYLKLRTLLPDGGRMAIGIGDDVGLLEVPLSIRQGNLLSETGHSLQALKMAKGKMTIINTISSNVDTNALWSAISSFLAKKLDELTLTQVEVLLRKLWNDDITQTELASTLGMNQSVISRHLSAAWYQQIKSTINASQSFILSLNTTTCSE